MTLLPRHWEWLNAQSGGASVAIRKLVEEARRANSDKDRQRAARDAAYHFMSVMAGNRVHFEEAARALLAVSPRTETALELLKHRLQAVRGRAILGCLAHAPEAWARAALEKGAPHALAYRVAD